jgi:AraC-like DNA-binding protein
LNNADALADRFLFSSLLMMHSPLSLMSTQPGTNSSEGPFLLQEAGQRGGEEHTLAIVQATRRSASISLRAPVLVYYGMLTGQAALHGPNGQRRELEAGASLLVPPLRSLQLRVGEDADTSPRWLALKIDRTRVRTLMNTLEPLPEPTRQKWALQDRPYCFVEQTEGIVRTLRMMAFMFEENPPDRDALLDLNVQQLLIYLLQTRARPLLTSGHARHSADGGLAAAVQYIQDHLDRHISIDELVEEACMSKSSFYRHFSDEFDMSPLEYITQERVARARALLTDRSATVAEVSHALGFSSTSYFIDMFKEHVGKTPKQYQLDVTGASDSSEGG